MNYEYIMLAPGYAREALEAYDAWEDRKNVPMKVQELMMVLRIEVSRRYGPPWEPTKNKVPILKDTKLS
jgi:hypothetical protein